MKHFAKSGQKIIKTAFMKKNYLFFQKLNTKKKIDFSLKRN